MNYVKHIIDVTVIIPGAVGCLVTGLCYSLFTGWGFFKHGWVAPKWTLSLALMLSGTFYLGPRVSLLLELSKMRPVAELSAELR